MKSIVKKINFEKNFKNLDYFLINKNDVNRNKKKSKNSIKIFKILLILRKIKIYLFN